MTTFCHSKLAQASHREILTTCCFRIYKCKSSWNISIHKLHYWTIHKSSLTVVTRYFIKPACTVKINYLHICDYIRSFERYGLVMLYPKRCEKSTREAVSDMSNWWSKRNAQSKIPYENPLSNQLNGHQLSGQQHCNVSRCRSMTEFATNYAPVPVKANFKSGAIVDPKLMLAFLRYRLLMLKQLEGRPSHIHIKFYKKHKLTWKLTPQIKLAMQCIRFKHEVATRRRPLLSTYANP